MLCFQFIGDRSVRVRLCEETIRYSAVRAHGVLVGANVVASWDGNGEPYLYALHRRAFSSLKIAPARSWRRDADEAFPYSRLFKTIAPERLVALDQGRSLVRLLGTPEIEESVTILPGDASQHFDAVEEMSGGAGLDPDAPFTLVRLGPFPKCAGSYLFRFEFCISGSSYRDVIPEDLTTATRLYRVYGPSHIWRDIVLTDIPRALRRDRAKYQSYANWLRDLDAGRRLVPDMYSIVAVDNANCDPARLRCIDLTADLEDMSGAIDPRVYCGDSLGAIPGRLHWFVSRKRTNDFYLQMTGPIALSDLAVAA